MIDDRDPRYDEAARRGKDYFARRAVRDSDATLDVPPIDSSSMDAPTHSAAGFTKADSVSTLPESLEEHISLPLLKGREVPGRERGVTAGAAADEVREIVSPAEGARDDVVRLAGRSAAVDALGVSLEESVAPRNAGHRTVYLVEDPPTPDIAALEAAAEALARHNELAHAVAVWAIVLRLRMEVTNATP